MEGSHDTEVDGKSVEQLAVWMIAKKEKLEAELDTGKTDPQQAERQWQQVVQAIERVLSPTLSDGLKQDSRQVI